MGKVMMKGWDSMTWRYLVRNEGKRMREMEKRK